MRGDPPPLNLPPLWRPPVHTFLNPPLTTTTTTTTTTCSHIAVSAIYLDVLYVPFRGDAFSQYGYIGLWDLLMCNVTENVLLAQEKVT